MSNYDELYEKSIKNPEEFWHSMAMKTLIWMELCTKENTMKECDISKGVIKWFDGTLNASGELKYYVCRQNQIEYFISLTVEPLYSKVCPS